MAVHGAIDPAEQYAVVKGGVFRRLGRAMALAAAALATALLMASTASAQLYTSTTPTTNWANTTGGAGGGLRWSTSSSGTYNAAYVSGSNTSFTTAGTYTFAKLVASGSANLGDITTAANANIVFSDGGVGIMNFGAGGVAGGDVKTLNFGTGSVVDFGGITTVGTNGINKSGAGTLMLTGGAYTGGFTLNAGNVIARGGNALGTGNIVINGGAIGATQSIGLVARASGKTITVAGDFQLGTSGTFNGAATDGFNISFLAANNGLNLNNGARTITLGSSGSMTFGQGITNGSLTLNRLSGASGQFGLSAANTMSALTLDSVKVNARTNNAALGDGTVTLRGADATTLNIEGARTIGNAFTIADSGGTKTITGNNNSAIITGTITNSDSTGGLTIGSIGATNFTVGVIDGAGTTGVTFGSSALLGTVTMSGASSYAGDTRIDSSTLKMSGAGAVPNGKLVFQGTGAATFDLNGTTQTVAKLDDSALAGIIKSSAVGGQLVVGDSTDSTFAGTIISGASLGIEKIGSGKLTLTGANTYSGGTTVSAGSLVGTTSSLQGAITNNAAVTFSQSTSGTYAGVMSGNGSLTKLGAGAVTLTGANTYSGGTTISAGELEVSSQSLRGDVVNNGTLTFNQAVGDGTFAGNISGNGSFFKNGGDALTLTGVNTYSGGTTVTGGELIGSTAALQGNIQNNGQVTFRQTVSGTYAGVMSGAGALVKDGAGNVTLSGANTYAAGTTISAGGLTASTGSLPLNGNVDAATDTTLTFDQNSAGTFGGVLSGDGALVKLGSGAVTLTGANTYSGGTTVTEGSLVGTTTSLQGAITNNAAVTFNQSTAGTYAGVMSGNGSLTKLGGGAVTLTGANTYSGGTTVSAGSLVGTTTSLQGAITNNAAVTFNQSTSGTYAGVMSGNGSLTKLGSGAVTLTGANTYSGATTVSAGTLLVNGSLANSAVTVGNGGTLGGSGTLGGLVTVQSGGTLSPGNSPGQLFLSAVRLEGGSMTLMEVLGNGANAGVAGTNYDQLQVSTSGGLRYGGGLNLNFGNSLKFLNGTTFDLFVFSGTPIGNFSAVTSTGTGLYAGFNFSGSGGIWTSTIGDQLLTLSELTGRLTFSSSGGSVPEIDPATGGSALSLVAGVLAILEQRRRRRGSAPTLAA